jgi:membrane protein DedA with SNARE-associated domain
MVIVVGIVGSVVGSLIAYAVGRTGGRRFVDRYGKYVLLTHSDLDRVESWFGRRGEWMVLYGRVIPVVRTFISFPAGMAEMKPVRFTVLTTIGCAAWVSMLSVIGYEVGGQWQSVTKGFSYASYVVVAIAVVAIVAFVWHRLRAVRREAGLGAQAVGSTDRSEQATAVGGDAPSGGVPTDPSVEASGPIGAAPVNPSAPAGAPGRVAAPGRPAPLAGPK